MLVSCTSDEGATFRDGLLGHARLPRVTEDWFSAKSVMLVAAVLVGADARGNEDVSKQAHRAKHGKREAQEDQTRAQAGRLQCKHALTRCDTHQHTRAQACAGAWCQRRWRNTQLTLHSDDRLATMPQL